MLSLYTSATRTDRVAPRVEDLGTECAVVWLRTGQKGQRRFVAYLYMYVQTVGILRLAHGDVNGIKPTTPYSGTDIQS